MCPNSEIEYEGDRLVYPPATERALHYSRQLTSILMESKSQNFIVLDVYEKLLDGYGNFRAEL